MILHCSGFSHLPIPSRKTLTPVSYTHLFRRTRRPDKKSLRTLKSGEAAVNPDIARIQRMRGRYGALSHDGGHNGHAGTLGKPCHGFSRAGDIDAASHQEDRPLSLIHI